MTEPGRIEKIAALDGVATTRRYLGEGFHYKVSGKCPHLVNISKANQHL